MGTPTDHANTSAKRFGGNPKDYIEIHELMDSSKEAYPDLRHRALTHHPWFYVRILERIFGRTIKNSDGNEVSVRDIGQFHVQEDYRGNLPSASDFLSRIKYEPWMDSAKTQRPPSSVGLPEPDLEIFYLSEGEEAKKAGDNITPPFNTQTPDEAVRPRGSCGAPGTFD